MFSQLGFSLTLINTFVLSLTVGRYPYTVNTYLKGITPWVNLHFVHLSDYFTQSIILIVYIESTAANQ